MKTNFWKLCASKDNTPLTVLQVQLRDWELASDTNLGHLIPSVPYRNTTNRRTGLSTTTEEEITRECLLHQRRQIEKERRGLKKDIKKLDSARKKPSYIKAVRDI